MFMLCTSSGREVITVKNVIFKAILSIMASVISYFICKWLDRER